MQTGKSVREDIKHETQDTRHKTQDRRTKIEDKTRKARGIRHEEETSSLKSRALSLESPHRVILTFGVFDGVHIAHQIVIGRVVKRARTLDTDAVVISFDPHPALPIFGQAPLALTTTAKRIELLEALGIDRVAVEDFNEWFSQLLPEEFVRDVLVGKFRAQEVVVGYDCAFGKERAGDRWLLKELGEKYGFAVDVVEPYRLNGTVVSSTRIRTAILQGDLDLARKLLGRPYSLSGPVVKGKGMGGKIGYPTANLQLQEQVVPPSGIYAVKVQLGGRHFGGLLSMGVQPTFGENEFRIEAHLLDFEGTLYGQDVEVFFVRYIRGEKVFAGAKELADQIRKDEAIAREILDSGC